MLTREGYDWPVRAAQLLEGVIDGIKVVYRSHYAAGHDHRSRLTPDLLQCNHLVKKVVDNDFGLLLNRSLIAFDISSQPLCRTPGIKFRIARNRLDEAIVTSNWCIRLQHIENEPLFDRLLHRVCMERAMLSLTVLNKGITEHFESFVLGRGREGKIRRVPKHFSSLYGLVYEVLNRIIVPLPRAVVILATECLRHRISGLPALAGVSFVDDDREPTVSVLVTNLSEDKREFLDGRDDDLLAALDHFPKVRRVLRVANGRTDLRELLDGIPNLTVQDTPIGHDHDRVESPLRLVT